ncbi:MAG: hypothetical protein M3238_06805 [Actinomycetota bacterium]|nr:hypothetical protein [Actinomycetota bacterium]
MAGDVGRLTLDLGHSATSGGTNIDQIVLAGGVVALGVAFLIQKTVDRRVSALLVVIGVAGVVASLTVLKGGAALGEPSIEVQGETYTESQLGETVVALCDARDAARRDVTEANEIFLDRGHVPLHVIAVALEDDDRIAAGNLLEAKQRVEQDLIDDVQGTVLANDLDRLKAATVASLEALDLGAPTC